MLSHFMLPRKVAVDQTQNNKSHRGLQIRGAEVQDCNIGLRSKVSFSSYDALLLWIGTLTLRLKLLFNKTNIDPSLHCWGESCFG